MEKPAKKTETKKWQDRPADVPDGKTPPAAVEMEMAVLGTLMLEKDALMEVIDLLKPQTFYKEAHRRIFAAICDLYAASQPVDILTVTNKMRQNGDLVLAGGPFFITQLTAAVNSAANIVTHARIIQEMAMKREIIRLSGASSRDAYEDSTDVFELIDGMGKSLYAVSELNIRRDCETAAQTIFKASKELEHRVARCASGEVTGVPSGFAVLDRLTSGFQKQELTVVAARPGMGKTAFALSIARNAAIDFKMPVAVFSLEMSSVELMMRLIAAEARIHNDKLRSGRLSPADLAEITAATNALTSANMFFDDTPGLGIMELRAKCRRLKSRHGIQLIVIDYIQLMTGDADKAKSGQNREQEIAGISRALKNMAKELDVPVIALAQLSRSVETRGGNKRPMLSDLRESGAIEQDADAVMFLYRPEYYGLKECEDGTAAQGMAEVIISKNRNGAVGAANLRFEGIYTRFSDPAEIPSAYAEAAPEGVSAQKWQSNMEDFTGGNSSIPF